MENEKIEEKQEEQVVENDLIDYELFAKIKLRVAQIMEAEPVAKSKKLVKLQVNLGSETRQILAGISQFYTPEELVGKKIIIVANLKPAKLMGLESQGMLLAASTDEEGVILLQPEKDISVGAEVR